MIHREMRRSYQYYRRDRKSRGRARANEAVNKNFMRIFTFTRDGGYNSSDVRIGMK